MSQSTARWWRRFLRRKSNVKGGCWILQAGEGIRFIKGRPYFNWQRRKGKSGNNKKRELPATSILARALDEDVAGLVASHLCHNGACVNPKHVVFEPQGINAHRTRCPAGTMCPHFPACLAPGSLSNEKTTVVYYKKKQYHRKTLN